MSMPWRLATCQMVSPSSASTSLPSRMNFTNLDLPLPAVIAFRLSPSPAPQWSRQFIRKIFQNTQQRIWGRLAKPTNRRIAHRRRQLFQELYVPGTLGHQLGRFLGPDAAGRALAAALVLEKLHQIQRHSLDVVLVGEDHNRVRPYEAAVFFQCSKIERNIGQRGRQYAARRATGQIGLEYMAILHATAKLIDKLTHGDAGGGQLDAWVLHAAGNREAAEALAVVAAL